MGATFSRVHTWVSEVLNHVALNAEFDNILNNLEPSGVGSYSANAAEMQTQTDPGEVGSESLAPSLAGELERIRFAIAEIKGSDVNYWYESMTTSLSDLLNSIGGSIINNRVVSGKVSGSSNSPRYLIPAVSSNQLTLDATSPNFVYIINGTQYTITADQILTTLGTAPTTNNTALVNDASLTSQESSKWVGEDGRTLNIDNAGTEITSLVGKWAAFKIVQGLNTEYFMAYVKSATELTSVLRGYFFDNLSAPIPRIAISDNATITLMRLTWIYVTTAGGLTVAYTAPTYSYSQPTAPATGDYWFDMANMTWKQYNSIIWVAANVTLIGVSIQDGTNCVGARAFDFAAQGDDFNTLELEYVSATQIRHGAFGGKVAVGTSTVKFENTFPTWDITTNIESGFSEAASTTYFAYVGETGQLVLSPHKPYTDAGTYRGLYHPYELWRFVGSVENNSASDFNSGSVLNGEFYPSIEENLLQNLSVDTAVSGSALTVTLKAADGSSLSGVNAGLVAFRSGADTDSPFKLRRITAPLTMTVSSGSTLGTTSAVDAFLTVYLVDTGSAVVMGIANGMLDDGVLQSSTAEGGAGGADSANVLYTAAAQTSKAIRAIARIRIQEATAGTWATDASEVKMLPRGYSPYAIFWSGYHSTGTWPRTSASYGDPTADGSSALATRQSVNFPAVTTFDSGGSPLPGIKFTPPRPGMYHVVVSFAVYGASAGHKSGIRLFLNGSTAIGEVSMVAPANQYNQTCTITSTFYAASGSETSLRLQTKNDSGTVTIGNLDYTTETVVWTVVRIGD